VFHLSQPFLLGFLMAVGLVLGGTYVSLRRRRLAYRRRLQARLDAIAALPTGPRI
jgi:hypothetical protein